ncbi:MAG: VWA domain-containing protein [Proteobacteria bacterium]|nr:VWA domain-containing protein [Pseudomonadota bacterium]
MIHLPFTFVKPIFLLFWLLIPIVWISYYHFNKDRKKTIGHLVAVGIRSLLIVFIGLALAEPGMRQHTDNVDLFFVLDQSDSITKKEKTKALEFIKKTTSQMTADDRGGLIVFGKHPFLEATLSNNFGDIEIQSDIETRHTNISEALQLAIGRLPTSGIRRIVLLSDGNQTVGNAGQMAGLASSLGIEIYPVTFASRQIGKEVFLDKLETPKNISLETPFEVKVQISSSDKNRAELLLLRNDELVSNTPITLHAGKNLFRFTDVLKEPGLYLYKAIVNPHADTIHQNNSGSSFTYGTQKSGLLVVTKKSGVKSLVTRVLRKQGFSVTEMPADKLSQNMSALIDYRAVILDNVPARSINPITMKNIENYVKDTGGGLLMTGGDESFGAGRYQNTPIERALPVFMDIPTTMDFPSLCLILVIDKSSSMSGYIAGNNKLQGAKIAAFSTIEMLNPFDKVGVLAFDSQFEWIVPITKAENRQDIANKLNALAADGGTNLYPGLNNVFQKLGKVKAARKHIIVLSDGITDEIDYAPLIKKIHKADITISTVAIGYDSNREFMESIAEWGEGRSFFTDDVNQIPRIFVYETKIVTKNIITERHLQPRVAFRNEISRNLISDQLPPIYGMDISYSKPGATNILQTDHGPLLATWRYGLGRSAAFTSDLSGIWSQAWLNWDHFGSFLSTLVRWIQQPETEQNIITRTVLNEGQVTFTAEITDKQKNFVNNLSLQLGVLFPSNSSATTPMEQDAPGVYKGAFTAEESGEYYLSLHSKNKSSDIGTKVFGFTIPYGDEYRARSVNYALLHNLAETTGGRTLTADEEVEFLFSANLSNQEIKSSFWPYLLAAFLFLLILDILIRQVILLKAA